MSHLCVGVLCTAAFAHAQVNLSPGTANFQADGGTQNVSVINPSPPAWTATKSNDTWVTFTSPVSGNGDGSFTYSVAANPSAQDRDASITVTTTGGARIHDIRQQGGRLSISPSFATVGPSGGGGDISVTAPQSPALQWTVTTSDPSWISIPSGDIGVGQGVVRWTVSANPTGSFRQGTITVTPLNGAGQTFSINQAAGNPTPLISVSPSSVNPSAAGVNGSLQLSATPSSLSWTAASNATTWLRITSAAAGTGNGSINYTADPNPTAVPRTATITVAPAQGSNVVVAFTQSGGELSTSPASANAPAAGDKGTITISTSDPALRWTAAIGVSAPWATFSPAEGTGPGVVNWSAAANTLTSGRSAAILITPAGGASRNFLLNQQTADPGLLSLTPSSSIAPASGSSGSLGVTASPATLTWIASSNQGWLTIASGGGTGNGTVQYVVAPTPSGVLRTAEITVTPTQITVAPFEAFPVKFVLTQSAGVVTIEPASISANPSGATGQFAVRTSNATLEWTASTNPEWLTLTSSSSGTGDRILQWAAAANNTRATRNGTITITPSGGSGVQFNVSQQRLIETITVSPQSLAFSYQQRGRTPAETQITVRSDSDAVSITIAPATDEGNWLRVTGQGPTPAVLTVSVNPSDLAPGTYRGAITISSDVQARQPFTVPVTLTVTPSPILTAEPNGMTFSYQQNGTWPAERAVTLKTSIGDLDYSILPDPNASWLSATGAGPAPSSILVSVNPRGLQPGTYHGNVIINAPAAGNSPFHIPVSFQVSAAPSMLATPTAVSVSYQRLSSVPAPISLRIDSTGSALPITASSSVSWLGVFGGGQTSANLEVTINPERLAPGTHQGAVIISSAGAANNPLSVPVTIEVTEAPSLAARPAQVSLVVTQGGQPNASTQIAIVSASPIPIAVQVSSQGNWLSLQSSGAQTPATLSVSAQTGTLGPGTYTGTITITSAGAGNSPFTIPVSLTISPQPRLTVNPDHLSFAHRIASGTPPAAASLVVSAPGDAAVPVSVSISGNAMSWLSVRNDVTTPAVVQVSANPTGLLAGTLTGTLTIESPGYLPLTIPVDFQVTAAPLVTVQPASVSFSFQRGNPTPSAQTVELRSNARLLYSTSKDAASSWLVVSGAGQTDSSVSISVNPSGLEPGTYGGAVAVFAPEAGNSPVLIPVSLAVTEKPILASLPSSLSFTYTQRANAPTPLALGINSSQSVNFSTAVSPATPWLIVSGPAQSPGSLQVSIDPTGLDTGDYRSTILLSSPDAANSPLAIPVSIHVQAAPQIVSSLSELTFSYQLSGPPAANQTLLVTGSNPDLVVTASGSTFSGGSWLTVAGGGNVPAGFSVSVNHAGLEPGTYLGSITFDVAGGAANSVTVPVRLIIAAAPVLTASPSEITLAYRIGGTVPPIAPILVESSSGSLPVQASSSTDTGGSWLQVTGGSSAPGTVTPTLNPVGLAPGVYRGSISLAASSAGNSPLVVPVTLTITTALTLSSAPTSLQFTSQQGGPSPSSQVFRVASSGSAVLVNYSVLPGAPWLSVNGGPTTASDVSVTVSSAGLAVGRYTATILARSEFAANDSLTIPVTLDIAAVPVLTVAPGVVHFAYRVSGIKPPAQVVSLGSSGSPIDFEVSVLPGAPWLFSSSSNRTPGDLQVEVDPGNLSPGDYTGVIFLRPLGGGSPAQVVVALRVTVDPVLVVAPTQLDFSYQINRDLPPNRNLVAAADRGELAVSATVTGPNPGNWLTVKGGGATPTQLTVTANPTGLAPGTYTSQLLVSAPGASGSIPIPVSLTVSSSPSLTVFPTALTLDATVGDSTPPNRRITVGTSDGSALNLAVQAASGSDWLQLGLDRSVTPAVLTVSARHSNLSQGIYYGSISISSSAAANSPQIVPVVLRLATRPTLQATPLSVQFAAIAGGAAPSPATISLTGGSVPLDFVTSVSPGASWLTVTFAGRTPTDIAVSGNPTGLAPGIYHATILINSPNAAFPNVSIPVHMQVTAGMAVLTGAPNALSFTSPGATQQSLNITSSGQSIGFSAEPSPSTPWLKVQATGSTPQSMQVSVDDAGLSPGTYQGWIKLTSAGAANSPLTIPVVFTVSRTAALQASPAAPTFVFDSDLPFPGPRTVAVTLGGLPATGSTATVAPGTPWLSAQSTSGGMLSLNANPSGLLPGTYSGSVLVNSLGASNSPLVVPVSFQVMGVPTADFSRDSVVLLVARSSAPVSTVIQIGGNEAPVDVDLDPTTSTWMSISPLNGKLPLTITITAQPAGLRPGNYSGSVIINSAGRQIGSVPVILMVAEQPGIAAAQNYMTFSYYRGGNTPRPLDLQFVRFSEQYFASALTSDPWLSVNPPTPSASGPIEVSANPEGLAPGTHVGRVTLSLTDRPGGPPLQTKEVPVEFYVDQPANPRISAVVNGASFLATPLTPGLIFSIMGSGLGPSTPASMQLRTESVGLEATTYQSVARSLAGVQVLVNGIQCPLLYVSDTQINAIAPYAVYTKETAKVIVRYRGVLSHEALVNVAPSAPGIFSLGQGGTGQGAILNEDLSVNSQPNPAAKGSLIALFAGGDGQTNPQGVDGLIATDVLPRPMLPVSVTIGGIPATDITYAGAAPTLTAGALQVNVRIPDNVPSGNVPVILKIGDAISQQGITVNVR